MNKDGDVFLFVADSGPGVPVDKRDKLVARYQDSLKSLSQVWIMDCVIVSRESLFSPFSPTWFSGHRFGAKPFEANHGPTQRGAVP